MKKLLVAFCLLFLLHHASNAASEPNPSLNPVLATIQKTGAKLYYLGTRATMDGWLIVKDGQIQIAYATSDNKNIVIGAFFGENGENVTALQVSSLVRDNPEIAALLQAPQKSATPPAATPPAPSPAPTPNQSSPGERLLQELGSAATVVIGQPSTPEIIMVMDPYCPHCRDTWQGLRDAVMKGSLHLRLVPIGTVTADSERAAAMLLHVADPTHNWDKSEAGDMSVLGGTPSAEALADIRANRALIDKWKIHTTPYLVYRGKDGKVKIVQGEPTNISSLTTDLGL